MDTTTSTSPINILFAILSIAAGSIAYKGAVPPNPKPAHAEKKDVLFEKKFGVISLTTAVYFSKYILLYSGILAAILCLDHPNTSTSTSGITTTICPNHANLSPTHITPTPYSLTLLITAVLSGLLRLEAFRQLGPNFTFHLAKPSGLNTSGLYRYVQHPSYTGSMFMMTSLFFLWFQPYALLSCIIPFPLTPLTNQTWLLYIYRIQFLALVAWGTRGRVREEEAMMKREFGREWEIWSARTWRFVPCVF